MNMQSPPYASARFKTDTATLAVFDPATLAHRATDDADWWSIPAQELAEVNAGNVFFVGLEADGAYECEIYRSDPPAGSSTAVFAKIRNITGSIYVGAGEQVPGANFGPSTMHGGVLVAVGTGTVLVTVERASGSCMRIWLSNVSGSPENSLKVGVQL